MKSRHGGKHPCKPCDILLWLPAPLLSLWWPRRDVGQKRRHPSRRSWEQRRLLNGVLCALILGEASDNENPGWWAAGSRG